MSFNAYQVLYVEPTCSDQELKSAYRLLVKSFHPDAATDKTRRMFDIVQEAYAKVATPEKRAAYDRSEKQIGSGTKTQPRKPSYQAPSYQSSDQGILTCKYTNYSYAQIHVISAFFEAYHSASDQQFGYSFSPRKLAGKNNYGLEIEATGPMPLLDKLDNDLDKLKVKIKGMR